VKAIPLISVIVPVFNGERYLSETLQSVMNQTHSNFEALIVDDGSTDGTKDVVSNLAQNDARIKYVYQANQGVSAARNTGIKYAKGEYLAFLDYDDLWEPENLELKILKFQEDNYGMVHSDAKIIDEHSLVSDKILSGKEGMLLESLLEWKETQIPGPSSILVSREALDKTGLFDVSLSTSADQDFFIRVASAFKIGRVAQCTWKYRIHGTNMHKNISVMEKDVVQVFKKAAASRLFKSRKFKNACFANMYLILGASWYGDGKNKLRGIYFVMLALASHPLIILNILKNRK
jgi:glycosyltransferase involved in cell wall biosynthesis